MQLVSSGFSSLDGTCCYCSQEAAEQIRQALDGLPLRAAHFLGTGDYHYISLFWLERLQEPFALVLFDNHPDDQPCAFGSDILSCGSWVADARQLPMCKAVAWFDGNGRWQGNTIPKELPVYLSIDLDVLSEQSITTNWNQGNVRPEELHRALCEAVQGRTVLGADICGGPAAESGESDFTRSLELAQTLISFL